MNNDAPIPKTYDKNTFREYAEKEKRTLKKIRPFDNLFTVACFLPFILIGGMFFFIGCNELHNISATKKVCDVLVQGTVAEYNEMTSTDSGHTLYAPVFVYEYEGEEYRYAGDFFSNRDNYKIGQKVDIYISSDNPYRVKIYSYDERKKDSYISSTILGGVFFFGSLILLIMTIISKIRRINKWNKNVLELLNQ